MKKAFSGILLFLIISMPTISLKAQLKNPRNIPFKWQTDTINKTVDLSEITVVLPRRSFPAIDYPAFLYKADGLKNFFKHEPVIAVVLNKEAKAYPLNMLTMHEISNDSLGGVPILPTYCPLCNSSMVYDRRLKHNGKDYLLDFEVSGMLRKSDMIMADKQTETWWQQLIGKGLVGKLAGAELTVIPSVVISVEDFFNSYPAGKILSPKTGTKAENRYGFNPYKKYDSINSTPYKHFFDTSKISKRLKPMERVIDVEGKDGYKIYPFSVIAKKKVINDTYSNKNIVIFYKEGTVSVLDTQEIIKSRPIGAATVFLAELEGKTLTFKRNQHKFIDLATQSVWDITGRCIAGELVGKVLLPIAHSNHFAFAWLAFYPDSEIYKE